jgi:hypothetical protein
MARGFADKSAARIRRNVAGLPVWACHAGGEYSPGWRLLDARQAQNQA